MPKLEADIMPALIEVLNPDPAEPTQKIERARVVVLTRPDYLLLYQEDGNPRPALVSMLPYAEYVKKDATHWSISFEDGILWSVQKIGRCACGSPLTRAPVASDMRSLPS